MFKVQSTMYKVHSKVKITRNNKDFAKCIIGTSNKWYHFSPSHLTKNGAFEITLK